MPALLDCRQEAFCRLFLTGLDATAAAIKAGYLEKGSAQSAFRISKLHHVIESLAEMRVNERLQVHADQVPT